ncbi:MAG: PilZ domain-containing protein [Nitrospirae bacterium]|nr:PilZ domain-containing protein [Nitrospirota bacterium]
MEKRASERLAVKIQLRLFYGNIVYTGIVTNLSENGMFICTKMSFPVDSVLIAIILLEEQTLKLPIKIRRAVRSNNHLNDVEDGGIGVSLLNPSKEYIDFIRKTSGSLLSRDNDSFISRPINPSIDLS